MVISNSWMQQSYEFPTMAVAYCKNSTDNGYWCKSPEEIDAWLGDHIQYFVYQDTKVQSYIWEDHPIVDDHPYYGDENNYFPTVKQMVEWKFAFINVDP